MKERETKTRATSAKALGFGVLVALANLGLIRLVGAYSMFLFGLAVVAVSFGAIGLVWGDSFRTMPLSQKIPAALIPLLIVGVAGVKLMDFILSVSRR